MGTTNAKNVFEIRLLFRNIAAENNTTFSAPIAQSVRVEDS